MKVTQYFILTALGFLCLSATTVQAQDTKLTTSYTGTGISEYRFRGLSLSNKNPAVQGSIAVGYGNFSGGAWASTLSNSVTGADVEVDLYGSYNIQLDNNWSLGIGGTAYTYLGGSGLDYFEANTSLNYSKNS